MIKAHRLTPENLEKISGIYEEFRGVAQAQYRWAHEPVPFDQLKQAFSTGFIRGYVVEDTARPDPLAFMLCVLEEHRAIEINAFYIRQEAGEDEPARKTVTDRVMRAFIADNKDQQGIDVVSFPMLGEQEKLVRVLPWYGFKPVGQAIVKFNIMDSISLQIMKQQQLPDLPEGYRLDHWRPEYAGGVANAVFEAFEKATDSLWDPRFRTLLGAKKVVGMIDQGMMGAHIPACTSVLLKNNDPVGFCFLVQASMQEGNIPLIGVKPSEKGKGLGNHLLKHSLEAVVEEILAGRIGMLEVSATHDTDNIAAIKMYRRMGFREEYNYPHGYLTKEKMQTMVVGKWC